MTEEEISAAQQTLTDWEVVSSGEVSKLKKAYRFKNFLEALAFTNQVGALAEDHDHHPDILTEWGRVTITWWTHSANGLTQNDFAMASRVDEL
jgi:4a-hydroxytetrahydrobiopterin dehydratase